MSTAIEFNHVGKQYRLGVVSTGTIAHDLNRWWQTSVLRREDPYLKIGSVNDRAAKADSEYVWALRDIDFKVEQGDVVGIIGKNGAGKSTLLKLLSKVTAPTTGSIRARGRIASLLEVGTGFHQEMTGRENIYMNGAILGMTKQEISRKLDEIIDFSGCERYIDTPVKRYSSGMMVRLGFAVAAHLDPEILVVDEVLAVGDAEFQKKAIGKMQSVSQGDGRTVLFVSHNMTSIRALCNTGVLLENGMLRQQGNIDDIVDLYLQEQYNTSEKILDTVSQIQSYLQLTEISVNAQALNPVLLTNASGYTLHIHMEGKLTREQYLAFEFRLFDVNNLPLAFYSPSHLTGRVHKYDKGKFVVDEDIVLPDTMNKGEYRGSIYLTDPGKLYHLQMENALQIFVEGTTMETGWTFDYKGSGFLFLR